MSNQNTSKKRRKNLVVNGGKQQKKKRGILTSMEKKFSGNIGKKKQSVKAAEDGGST